MEYTILNNGVKMPLLGFGTSQIEGEECTQLVTKAIQNGYTLIDTAQLYANEIEVGKGIRQSGVERNNLFIISKIFRMSNSYEAAKEAIDTSLKRLGLDYVDLMLLHEPYKEGPEMYKALQEALTEGKVRSIGVSNYDAKHLEIFLTQTDILPAVNQIECHPFFQKEEEVHDLWSKGICPQAWAPLAQGKEHIFENPVLIRIANAHDKSVAQVVLRWLLQRGIPFICSTKHEERMIENMNIFDFVLDEEEMEDIALLDCRKTLFPWTEEFDG